MVRINSRCFVVSVKNVQYLVKCGKIDEFACLFFPSVTCVVSMTTSPVSWENEYQWYKRI